MLILKPQYVESELLVKFENLTGTNTIDINSVFLSSFLTKCYVTIENNGYLSYSISYGTVKNIYEEYTTTNNMIYLTILYPNKCFLTFVSDNNYSVTLRGIKV